MHRACAVPDIFGGSHTYVTTQGGIGFGSLCLGKVINDMHGPANGKKIPEHI